MWLAGWMRARMQDFFCSSNFCKAAAVHRLSVSLCFCFFFCSPSSPAVLGIDLHSQELFEPPEQDKQVWKLLQLQEPQVTLLPLCDLRAFLVRFQFSLLINPSLRLSRWLWCCWQCCGAVLILSPKKLQRLGSVIVKGTARPQENITGYLRGR